jgi:hypothetical protein
MKDTNDFLTRLSAEYIYEAKKFIMALKENASSRDLLIIRNNAKQLFQELPGSLK